MVFGKNIILKKNGFTLIELIIVMAIMAIVALGSFIGVRQQMIKARDTRRKSDLKMIKTSLALYSNICGAYPENSGNNNIVGCGAALTCATAASCSWGSLWELNGNVYMKILPKDPLATQGYKYTQEDNENYTLVSLLENMSDEAGEVSRTQCGYTHVAGKNEYVVCAD